MKMNDKNMPVIGNVNDGRFGTLLSDSQAIIEQARRAAYQSVNVLLVQRNWLLGKRIAEEKLDNSSRAEKYGQQIIERLADELTSLYGQGFDYSSLYKYVRFYKAFPKILDSSSPKSIKLSWTHYRILLQEEDDTARLWYENEAVRQTWSVRTLQRNISSQYYYRLLQSPAKDKVEAEMKSLTAPLQDRLEYMKNPVVAEFLGFHNNTDFSESDLERSILNHLPQFLMEMGKGFAFVERQKHIHTEKNDYYIDLVLY